MCCLSGRVARRAPDLGNVSETPTPTCLGESAAVRLPFVRQYAPHLYGSAFLASKLRRKGNPAMRLPFVRQYAPHLYGSTFGKILGAGVTRTFLKITHLICARPKYDLYDFFRGCFGSFRVLFLV